MRLKKRAAAKERLKRRISNIFILLILLTGICVLFYPAASDMINQFQQNKVVQGYAEVVEGQSKDDIDAMKKAAQLYNADLLKDEIIVDPFNQVKDKKAGIKYYKTLNPQNNGVMATVRIPSIEVSLPIYHGTSEDVLQKAIGHLEQTSLPVGGESTHSVISGHRGLPSAKLFTDLNLLKEGDMFFIDVLDETLAYKVDQIVTVLPHELEALAIEAGKDYVTLVTCTPYAINSHRLLVRGTRVPYEDVKVQEAYHPQETQKYDVLPYIVAACVLIVIIFIIIFYLMSRKKKTGRGRKSEK